MGVHRVRKETGVQGPTDFNNTTDASIVEIHPGQSPRSKPDPRTGIQAWCKFYHGDWRCAVSRFPPATERHALHLYMASIEQQGPLRDVPRIGCKILSVRPSHWYRVRKELIEGRFIQIHGDTIVVPLAQKAIASYQRRSTVNRQNALARYRDDIEEAE